MFRKWKKRKNRAACRLVCDTLARSKNLSVTEAAQQFCKAIELDRDYNDFPNSTIVELLRKYGATLSSPTEVQEFHRAATPEHQPYGTIEYRWDLSCTCVLEGLLKEKGLHSVSDMILAARMTTGDIYWIEYLDALIVEKGYNFCTEKKDIVALAGALKTNKGLLMLSVALGYQAPSALAQVLPAHHR